MRFEGRRIVLEGLGGPWGAFFGRFGADLGAVVASLGAASGGSVALLGANMAEKSYKTAKRGRFRQSVDPQFRGKMGPEGPKQWPERSKNRSKK